MSAAIQAAVTVSLVEEARGGPFVFWHDLPAACAEAARLGFDAVEIFPPSPEALRAAEIQRVINDCGLKIAAVGSGAGWVKHKLRLTDADAAVRVRAREFIAQLIDDAAGLGAPVIIGSMQGRWGEDASRDQALGWLAEGLHELAAHARQHGAVLLYEALNRYETNLFTRQEDAAAFVRKLDAGNVRLLCDLFHMNIEERSLADALRAAGPLVGHVHFVDTNRQAVGYGHLDVALVAAALREIDYAGYLSAECLPLPDSAAAAEQTIRSFRRWFR